jgi:hypothetical protein
MRKRAWLGLIGILCMLVGVLVWRALPQSDPIYKGKRLSLWLTELPSRTTFEAGFDQVIQKQGSAIEPHLIRALRTSDNLFWRPYTFIQNRAPRFIACRMPEWVEPKLVRKGAADWLAVMGPSAKQATPSLRRAASLDRSDLVRAAAVYALVRIGADQEGTKVLLDLLKDPAPQIRQAAAGGIEIWSPPGPEVVSALTEALNDSDPIVRQVCAAALGKYGPQAATAAVPLRKLAAVEDQAADYARRSLQEIEAATAEHEQK